MADTFIVDELLKLKTKACKTSIPLSCLKCGEENCVKIRFNDEEVDFECSSCDAEYAIDDVAVKVGEWVDVLEWIAEFKSHPELHKNG